MARFIQKKKLLIFIAVLIFMVLALLVSRFTYSYLGAYLDDDVITRGETTASGDTLIFIDGEPLSLKASTKNFHADAGNLSDSTKPGVRLISSGKTNNAKANYTVGFRINENTYKYSTSNNTPELLLAIYDENNNIVTASYDDLNFVTVTDGDGNEVSGFDITDLEGVFNVSVDHPITTTSSTIGTTHYWTFELIFVNLESDQSINENSNLNIDVILKQGMINTNYMLLALDNSSYNGEIWGYKDDITSIVIQSDDESLYSDASYVFDVSDEKDKGVMAYLVDNGDSTYTSYIQSKAGKVIANTNSQYLFAHFPNLESIEGIENLDVSNVTDMKSMFAGAISLINLDLSSWNTSNVTDMESMFNSGENTSYMSLETITFGPGWDTSNVTTMRNMFWNCANLTSLDVSMFKTQNVTDMEGMFGGYGKSMSLESITFGLGWDTSKVTTMRVMFQRQSNLTNLDVSNWDTGNVTDMSYMFNFTSSLTTIDVSDWDTSAVTNMSYMFRVATSLTNLDLSSWNTSNVTDMYAMFYDASSLTNLDLSSWNTSNVTDMSYMFSDASSLTNLDLSSWNTSNVTDMSYMFSDASSLTNLDLSSWNTSNVTDMYAMFGGYGKSMSLESITFGPGWDTSKVTTMRTMFQQQSKLTSLDLSMFNTSNVTDMSYMFSSCSSLTNLNFSNADFQHVTEYTNMFSSSVPSSIVVTVKDATAQTFIQNRLGSGKGTVNIL